MKILFILMIAGLFFIKNKTINFKTDLFLILFFLTGIISHLSHLYFGGVLIFIFEFLPTILLYYLLESILNSEEKIVLYLKFVVGFAAILALHGILQFYNNGIGWSGQTFTKGTTRIRYVGIFSDPNDLSLFFNMVIPFIVYYYIKTNKRILKLFNLILLAGFIYAIYLTQSRGALIGLYIMINYFIWKKYGLKQVVLINLITLPLLLTFKGRMTDIDPEEDSAYGRIEAWYEGFQMLKSYPLFGVGPGMFTEYHFRTAHNSFVLALAETGLAGYYFWIGSLYYSFIDLKNSLSFKLSIYDEEKDDLDFYLQISMIGFLASAFFLSRTYTVILYILLGLIAAKTNVLQKEMVTFINEDSKINLIKISGLMFSSIFIILLIYKFSL